MDKLDVLNFKEVSRFISDKEREKVEAEVDVLLSRLIKSKDRRQRYPL